MDAIRHTTLRTGGLARHEQHELWQEILSTALYPVRVRPVGLSARPLDARFRAAGARSARLTRGVIGPVRTDITAPTAAAAPGDEVELTLNRGQDRFVATPDDRLRVAPGELMVQTGDVATSHHADLPDEALLLRVPLAALTLDRSAVRRIRLRPLPLPGPAADVLRSAADHVLTPDPGLTADAAEKYLLGVAELVLRCAIGAAPDLQETAAARRRQVLDHLAAHLHRPDLTPDGIAHALGMSRRTLYALFAGTPGVAAELRRLRVERARALLADPACRTWSVDRIARTCGFTSRSHFSRVVLAATGHRPSDLRDA